MAIPDYQTLMLPLLKYSIGEQEYSLREAIEALAIQFKLSDEEKAELLPSGQQFIFANRIGWARTYLKKAGLLDSTRRGYVKITNRGKQVLSEKPTRIDVNFLKQFPSFVEFQTAKKQNDFEEREIEVASERTPEEFIEEGYQKIRKDLEGDILSRVKSCSPSFFERLVVELLVKMGYGGSRLDAGRAVGKSGDGGIDGIIKEDKLGLDAIYLQAKKWEGTVGRPEIQKFAGALQGQRARKGVFITTSSYSDEAWEYVAKIDSKIVLIDGQELARLMIDHHVGVSTVATYELKKIDSDYFTDE